MSLIEAMKIYEVECQRSGGYSQIEASSPQQAAEMYARQRKKHDGENVTRDGEEMGPLDVTDFETRETTVWWTTAHVVITWTATQVAE